MRLARSAPLLVALSLLTSASTAHAECAWVLWQNISFLFRQPGPPPENHLGMGEIANSRAECEKNMEALVKKETKSETRVERNHGLVTLTNVNRESGSQIVTSYRCLPDTMDRVGQRGDERHRRPPLAPLAPHQPRAARDAARALEAAGEGRVQEGARAEEWGVRYSLPGAHERLVPDGTPSISVLDQALAQDQESNGYRERL